QYGLVAEWPQRHSFTVRPSGIVIARPSASSIVIGPVRMYGPFGWIRMLMLHRSLSFASRILPVVAAAIPLDRRGREPEEHDLQHACAALQPEATRIHDREHRLATAGVPGVPHRAVDRHAGSGKARSRPRKADEIEGD